MDHAEWRQGVEARKARPARKKRPTGMQPPLLTAPAVDPAVRIAELLPVARALVAGALGNHQVREHLADYPRIWSEERQTRNPTVRVEFEHTIVIGGIGEGLAAGRNKNWGPVIGVFPLEPDDPVDSHRLLYLFKNSSPYQAQFDQRKYMRERMGKGFSKLVNRAMGATLDAFTKRLTAAEVVVIADRLNLTAREFWRAAKGRIDLRKREQRPLFVVIEE